MLSDDDVRALVGARHDDPFAVLGMRVDTQGRGWLRAVLPGARAVRVCRADDGRLLAELALRHPDGLWECQLALRTPVNYRLEVQWHGGTQGLYADAYACPPLIGDTDLHFLAEGTHLRPFEVLGAHALEPGSAPVPASGVRFAVWAPNARHVSVVGDFNAWDARRHPMRSRGGSGVWELFVPHAACGDRYKFQITAAGGQVLPLKCDPHARQAQLRPDTASVVAQPLPPAQALPAARAAANARQAPVSIYEVHLGSWRRHPDGRFHSWDELAGALPDYVASMGFTHIELLPVTEHPFDGSWGYQTLGLYAPTSRFGPPDGLARFVEACHARGIGVLLDWVPAHFPSDAHGLARFDGTALYEYADPREGFHRDWNTLIYNFGRHEVRASWRAARCTGASAAASTDCAWTPWPRCCTATTPRAWRVAAQPARRAREPRGHRAAAACQRVLGQQRRARSRWPRNPPPSPASVRPPLPAAWVSTTSGTWAGCTTRCSTCDKTPCTGAGTTTR
jgi:1,4-alpha-glucan branching enzyme